MAGATRNIMVRAGADFSAITKQSQKAAASMKKMSTSIASSAGLIKKALGAIGVAVSLSAIVSAAKDAKEAYEEQAEAQAKLAQVMHNTMGASADEVKSIKALCDAQQELGVIAGDVQMAGAQELATYLEQTSTLKKLIPVMNDMAAQQYGFNVTAESTASIATMLGKVMNGQVNALSRYGYKFDEAQAKILKFGTEEQRAAVLAQVVEQSVGGMNQALANTPTGRLKQLKNTMEDIKAQFGQAVTAIATAFLPLLMKVASVLSTIAKIATRVAQSIANVFGKKLEKGAAAVSTGAGTAAVNTQAIADSLGDVADKSKKAASAAKKAVRSLMGFDELNVLNSSAGSSAEDAVEEIGDAMEDLSDDVSFGSLFDFGEAVEGFSWLENALANLKERLGPIVDDIKKIFGGLYDFIAGVFTGDWERAFNGLGSVVEGFGALVSDVISRILVPAFDGLAGAVIERIGGLIDWIGEKTGLDLSKVKEFILYTLNFVRYYIEASAIKIGWIVQDLCNMVGAAIRGDWDAAWKAAQQLVADAATDILPTVTEMAVNATKAMMGASLVVPKLVDVMQTKLSKATSLVSAGFEKMRNRSVKAVEAMRDKVGNAWTAVIASTESMTASLQQKIGETWTAIQQNTETVWTNLRNSLQTIWSAINAAASNTWNTLKTNASDAWNAIRTVAETAWGAISAAASTAWGNISAAANSAWGSLIQEASSAAESIIGIGESMAQGIGNAMSNVRGFLSDALDYARDAGSRLASSLSGVMDTARNVIRNVRDTVSDLVTPQVTVQPSQDPIDKVEEMRRKLRGISHAGGGFVEEGPFFMNRGEIAGTFSNGKTVVANNRQITEGIAEATYGAFLRAMSDSGTGSGDRTVVINLDGREIARTTTKYQRQFARAAG